MKSSFNSAFYAKEYDFFIPSSDLVSLEVQHKKISAGQMQKKLPLKIHPNTHKPYISFIIPVCMDRITHPQLYSPKNFINLLQNLCRALPELTLIIDIVPTGELNAWNILREELLESHDSEENDDLLDKIKSGKSDVIIDNARAKGREIAEVWVESITKDLNIMRSEGHIIEIKHWDEFIALEQVQKLKTYFLSLYNNKTKFWNEFKSIIQAILTKFKSRLITDKPVLPPKIANTCIVQYVIEELAFQCYLFYFLNDQYDYHLYNIDNLAPILTTVALKAAKQFCNMQGHSLNGRETLQLLEFSRVTERFDLETENDNLMIYHYKRLRHDYGTGRKLSDLEAEFYFSLLACDQVASSPRFRAFRENHALNTTSEKAKQKNIEFDYTRFNALFLLNAGEDLTLKEIEHIKKHLLPKSSSFTIHTPTVRLIENKITFPDLKNDDLQKKQTNKLRFIIPIWVDRSISHNALFIHWINTFLECLCGRFTKYEVIVDVVLIKEIYIWDTVRDMLLSKARRNRLFSEDVENLKNNHDISSIPSKEFVYDYVEKYFEKIAPSINLTIYGLNQLGYQITLKHSTEVFDQEKIKIIKSNFHKLYKENKQFKKEFRTASHKWMLNINSELLKRGLVQTEIAKHYCHHSLVEKLMMQLYLTEFCADKYSFAVGDRVEEDILILQTLMRKYRSDLLKSLNPLEHNLDWKACGLPENAKLYRDRSIFTVYEPIPDWQRMEKIFIELEIDRFDCYIHPNNFMKKLRQTRIAFWNLTEAMAQLPDQDYSSEDLAEPVPVEKIQLQFP